VDPVPDPPLLFSGSAWNRTRASGSVAKNSDHETTEAVKPTFILFKIEKKNQIKVVEKKRFLLSDSFQKLLNVNTKYLNYPKVIV
jgi:hypothetical protein